MRSKNICKFVTAENSDKLDVKNFIYESNVEAMRQKTVLENNRVILLSDGVCCAKIGGMEWKIKKGELLLVFKGETMEMQPQSGCEYMYIDFDGARATSLFSRFGISKASRVRDGFDGIIPLWHDGLRRASEANLDLVAESMLLYAFSRLIKDTDEQNTLISKILEITENNFTDSALSVGMIAGDISYNAKYISHLFKEKMGVSYSEYLRNLRIKYAVSLLEHGIDSVKNIAFLSGFTDPMYFSTVFKKTVGVSPKDYMSRLKK